MAEPKRMAVVDSEGNVVNVVLVGDSPYQPPEGHTLVEDKKGEAEPGGKRKGTKWERRPMPDEAPDRVKELRDKVIEGTATDEDRDEMLLLLSGGVPEPEPDED